MSSLTSTQCQAMFFNNCFMAELSFLFTCFVARSLTMSLSKLASLSADKYHASLKSQPNVMASPMVPFGNHAFCELEGLGIGDRCHWVVAVVVVLCRTVVVGHWDLMWHCLVGGLVDHHLELGLVNSYPLLCSGPFLVGVALSFILWQPILG